MQNSNVNTNVNTNTVHVTETQSVMPYHPYYYPTPVAYPIYPVYNTGHYYQGSTYTHYDYAAPGVPNTGLGGTALLTLILLVCAAVMVAISTTYLMHLVKVRLAKQKS